MAAPVRSSSDIPGRSARPRRPRVHRFSSSFDSPVNPAVVTTNTQPSGTVGIGWCSSHKRVARSESSAPIPSNTLRVCRATCGAVTDHLRRTPAERPSPASAARAFQPLLCLEELVARADQLPSDPSGLGESAACLRSVPVTLQRGDLDHKTDRPDERADGRPQGASRRTARTHARP